MGRAASPGVPATADGENRACRRGRLLRFPGSPRFGARAWSFLRTAAVPVRHCAGSGLSRSHAGGRVMAGTNTCEPHACGKHGAVRISSRHALHLSPDRPHAMDAMSRPGCGPARSSIRRGCRVAQGAPQLVSGGTREAGDGTRQRTTAVDAGAPAIPGVARNGTCQAGRIGPAGFVFSRPQRPSGRCGHPPNIGAGMIGLPAVQP